MPSATSVYYYVAAAAGVLGLVAGYVSQLLMNEIFNNAAGVTIVAATKHHQAFFISIAWSLGTVVAVVLAGCVTLPALSNNKNRSKQDDAENVLQQQNDNDDLHAKLLLVRAEMIYLAGTVVGLIVAWMRIDLASGIHEILPNVLVLAGCMAVLAGIDLRFQEPPFVDSSVAFGQANDDKRPPSLNHQLLQVGTV